MTDLLRNRGNNIRLPSSDQLPDNTTYKYLPKKVHILRELFFYFLIVILVTACHSRKQDKATGTAEAVTKTLSRIEPAAAGNVPDKTRNPGTPADPDPQPETLPDNYSRFIKIGTRDGLSNPDVLDILRDSFGYLWIATRNGLNKADGYGIQRFFNRENDPSSLSDNFITSLAEDENGNVWIGTKKGLNRYLRSRNKFIRYSYKKHPKTDVSNEYIRALYADKKGHLWIETMNGLLDCLWLSKDSMASYYHEKPPIEGEYLFHNIYPDTRGNLWIGTRNLAVNVFDPGTEKFITSYVGEANCFATIPGRGIYIFGQHAILNYNERTHQFTKLRNFKIPFRVQSAARDGEGNIWMGGDGSAVVRYDPSGNRFYTITPDESDPFSVSGTFVNKIYCDPEGNVWIGTDNGLNLYPPGLNFFRHYRHKDNVSHSLTSNNVTSLIEDHRGTVWIGTSAQGIDTMDLSSEQFFNARYEILKKNPGKDVFSREKTVLKKYVEGGLIGRTSNQTLPEIFRDYESYTSANLAYPKINENKVKVLYEDRKGNVWAGLDCGAGFNRFDRKRGTFKRNVLYFTINQGDIRSINVLGANWYQGFLEDVHGNFWVTTWEGIGLNLYDREKQEFGGVHFFPRTSLFSRDATVICPFNDTLVWIGNPLGLLNVNSGVFREFSSREVCRSPDYADVKKYIPCSVISLRNIPVPGPTQSIVKDGEGNFWIANSSGLFGYDKKTDDFKCCYIDRSNRNSVSNDIRSLAYSPGDHVLYAGTKKGLFRVETRSGKLIPVHFPKILHQYLLSPDGKARKAISLNSDIDLANEKIISILPVGDELWMGLDKGLAIYSRTSSGIRYFPTLSAEDSGFLQVDHIVGKDGNIFLGTGKGIFMYDGKKKEFMDLSLVTGNPLLSRKINALVADSSALWIGTELGLFEFIYGTKKVNRYRHDPLNPNSLPADLIGSLAKIKNELWVSAYRSLCRMNTADHTVVSCNKPAGDEITSRLATCIFEDRYGYLWVGTSEYGINRVDVSRRRVDHFMETAVDTTSLLGNTAEAVNEDVRGTIWVGTEKGLNKFLGLSKGFRRYTHAGENAIANVKGILSDRSGKIWVSTINGLVVLDPASGSALRIGYENGLQDNKFSNACVKLRNGRMMFGGSGGISLFDPNAFHFSEKFPALIIREMKIRDSVWCHDVPAGESLTLHHNQNSLSCIMSVSDRVSPLSIRYRYRMTGYETRWNQTDAINRQVKYTNLSPGDYELQISSTNAYGIWNTAIFRIPVHIDKPWWGTWWMFTIYILFTIGSVILIVWWNGRLLRAKAKKLEREVDKATTVIRKQKEVVEKQKIEVEEQKEVIIAEKKKSDDLLLNILPHEVAEELKEKGSAKAKLIDEVTVLFTDFKDFTRLTEQLSAEKLVAEIHECFSAFDRIMEKNGLEKIKTIGDSYMAAGGLPAPNHTHASDAVKAALEIQQFMISHKARKQASGELFFEIRIGLHTGPVVAGIVGVNKYAYDIWGDTVNTASRMETCGESGKVNISGSTYELVKDQFNCEYRGKVTAKGKGEIDMYFVTGGT
ncbi:MAG: triple tyrosine motif-containing protein [Bacteroidetes bacterium]|nr:triple tyrosine motif-containing protein [Bacteroidota bacterium]